MLQQRMRRRLVAAGVAVALVAAAAVTVQVVRERERQADRRAAASVAARWLTAWQEGRYPAVDGLTARPDAPSGALQRTDQRLQVTRRSFTPGPLSADGREVPYAARVELKGLGELRWSSRLRLAESDDRWRVVFDAPTVHPRLTRGQRLDRRSRPSRRAELVDRRGRALRAASADLAGNVLGRRGGGTAAPTGLERVLDERLAGRAAGAVVLADASTGSELAEVQTYAGAVPAPVRTTLDLIVQRAAERAIDGSASPAALVAVDAATGQVRAAASRPVAGRPRALSSYAPGSVFKVVTAAALLEAGLTPDSGVDCPATYRGAGNASTVRPGRSTLRRAFAQSCNTTFLSQADALPPGSLARAAGLFGFGLEPILPIAAEGGDFPTGGGSADATAAIGQGRVEASPLLMASVLAAAQSGTWRQPHLVPGQPGLQSKALPPKVAAGLRPMLRAVVESGTGTAADLPGAPVHGKTGSAEVGPDLPVHAWFAGYRGGLAFCVFVERGESGGTTAAPIAASFLRRLG